VRGDLRRHAQHDDEVAKAVTIASDALEVGDVDRALEYLEWAKSDAPRSASVREALGIARYLAENWAGALTELQAYRRMSGRSDQNHLVADCLRALGRPLEMVAEAVKEMEIEEDGIDRVAEATIVWASALADAGDVAAGRAVLGRALGAGIADMDPTSEQVEEHHVRVWYVAGDLAERAGDHDEARAWFRRVATVDPELYDVEERLGR
jgi:tetratricopeptide (TPR) repeat protein